MKGLYDELDAELTEDIAAGINRFCRLYARSSARIHVSDRYRAIDRRLQALRKSGKIRYHPRTGWTLVDPKEVL